ncbi:MAG: carboxylating nicotinate-nucleotide diphosphorylase [Planctomycetaceae bacterium]|nr:carboxylating nicotinate-nucleotide diphosphorylase [Planctomycetaceae bacterium]
MNCDFEQLAWCGQVEEDCRRLVRLAVFEDLDRGYDWTTVALVPEGTTAAAGVVARKAGVIAGLEAARVALDEMDIACQWQPHVKDGDQVAAQTAIATIAGSARDLLTSERTVLNFLGRLSGIATLTRQYVEAIAGTKAKIYDTRKTTPGWRRLEKYAVRCGGGRNHRIGLFDAVLIKDNHLALGRHPNLGQGYTPAQAVARARQFISETFAGDPRAGEMIVEVEVDSLAQLREVLPAQPDIVLLDNMTSAMLREAVALRNAAGSGAELEASGGVSLATVRDIAESGVERISVGALTHSAVSLDVALDWRL